MARQVKQSKRQSSSQGKSKQQSQSRGRNNSLYLVLLLLLGISLGFAALTSQLNIFGNTTITKQSWDIHFEDVEVSDDSLGRSGTDINGVSKSDLKVSDLGTVTDVDSTEDTLNIEFNTKLDLPNDYFQFSVNITNDGTVDAMVGTVTENLVMTPDKWSDYLEYDISYENGKAIEANDKLDAGDSVTIVVTVTYKDDVDAAKLEEINDGGSTFASSFSMTYVQATTAAKDID